MVENNNNMRQTATHRERRRNQNISRHPDSEGVNSHISESTRRDKEHNHHQEENSRKERTTKMRKTTKRIGTIFSSLTMLFVLSLSANAASVENRNLRRDLNRADMNAEDLNRDANLNADEIRLDDIRFEAREVRLLANEVRLLADDDYRLADDRDLNNLELRAENLDENRRLDRDDLRLNIERDNNQLDNRNTLSRGEDRNLLNNLLADRLNADDEARDRLAVREQRERANSNFDDNRENCLDDLNA